MKEFSDNKIISSWHKNVKPWVTAIREGKIKSRQLITNKAIIETVLEKSPKTVLDVGCGEGWLIRELSKSGIDCLGIDVVSELIEYAKEKGGGRFEVGSYESLSFNSVKKKFDAIVCNFSLLGKESVDSVFEQAAYLLNEEGAMIIQTIHPISGCGEGAYKDGWREGSWSGFSNDFSDPAPWYFRTLETWEKLLKENGFRLSKILEPLNPETQQPVSIIYVGEVVI